MDKKKIAFVSLAHLSCDINGGALPATLPYIRAMHGFDYQSTAGLVLAYSCLSSLIQPFFGLLADKHSKPWFIPIGLILAGCGLALMGFMSCYWAIFAAITIAGIGSSFFHPEAARFANRVSGHSKGKGMSLFSIGGNAGFLVGPLLVSFFVGFYGLRGMAIFGFIGLSMAAILYWQIAKLPLSASAGMASRNNSAADLHVEESSAGIPDSAEAEELVTPQPAPECHKNNWREFFRLTGVIFVRSIVFTGCNTFIPLYLVNAYNQPKSIGALALVIFGGIGVCCNLLGGALVDRFGPVRNIRLAFCMMPLALLIFGLADSFLLSFCLIPLLSLALYFPFSAQVVLGQRLLAKNIGFASGVTLGLGSSLGGIAQPCLGWVADGYGLKTVFFALSCVALIGCLCSFLLSRKDDEVTD